MRWSIGKDRMKGKKWAVGGSLLLLTLTVGCEVESQKHQIRLQSSGSMSTAAIAWRDGSGAVQTDQHARMPWTLEYEAEPGTPVFLSVSSGSSTGRISITVFEDGEEVMSVPGCQCTSFGVSSQASGVVGEWAR